MSESHSDTKSVAMRIQMKSTAMGWGIDGQRNGSARIRSAAGCETSLDVSVLEQPELQ